MLFWFLIHRHHEFNQYIRFHCLNYKTLISQGKCFSKLLFLLENCLIFQMDIATTLLEYGAQADADSKAGFTPLHLSSQEGHSDMSSLLLEHNANPNYAAKVRTNLYFLSIIIDLLINYRMDLLPSIYVLKKIAYQLLNCFLELELKRMPKQNRDTHHFMLLVIMGMSIWSGCL